MQKICIQNFGRNFRPICINFFQVIFLHSKMEEYEEEMTGSESHSDDSEAYLLTEDVELQIQETLRALKQDDPAIYDKEKRFAPEIGIFLTAIFFFSLFCTEQ